MLKVSSMRNVLSTLRSWPCSRQVWHIVAGLTFTVAAILFTYPLITVASTHITYKPSGDQLFLLSILEWQRTTLFSDPGNIFLGNFYFGSGGALFGSDLLLGFLPVYAPIAFITSNPVFAYSITHIGAYILNALAMYVTVLSLTKSKYGALVAGAIYAFAPLQLAYASHLQFLGAWWLPLVLLMSLRFQTEYNWKYFAAAVVLVWIQFVTAVHLGVIAAMVLMVFAAVPAAIKIFSNRDWQLGIKLISMGTIVSLPFIPIVNGYLTFSTAWQADRDITELQFWSVQLRDYLSPTDRLRWYDLLADRFPVPRGERRVFPGFMPLVFAAVGVVGFRMGSRDFRRRVGWVMIALVSLGVIAVLFSLGTHWKRHEIVSDVSLPYLLLFDNVPVFKAIRVVARFSLLLHFALAILGGIGVAVLVDRLAHKWMKAGILALICALFIFVESFPEPLATFPVPDHAELRGSLGQAEDGPILFVPVASKEEIQIIWNATDVGVGPLVNGYSGHIWQQQWYFKEITQSLMMNEMPGLISGLHAYGIRTIVVDRKQIGDQAVKYWKSVSGLELVKSVRINDAYISITLADGQAQTLSRWGDVSSTFLATEVRPEAGFVVPVVVHNSGDYAWIPPGDSRVRKLQMEWRNEQNTSVLSFDTPVLPPPFLKPGQVHIAEMHIFTPSDPGLYKVIASADGEYLFSQEIMVRDLPEVAFSGSAKGMRSSLKLRTPSSVRTEAGSRVPFHVDAINTGKAIWTGPANIRLGWRWHEVGTDGVEREINQYEGRSQFLLGHIWGDIVPGSGYAFGGQLRVPDKPGRYKVRMSMLMELVAWFPEEEVEIEVYVTDAK